MSSPGKKPLFFFFNLSPNKQKTKHQSESNSVTSWTPSPWKASLYHAALQKVVLFLPASWLQRCLCESSEWTGDHHTQCVTPLPTPWEYNPAQPLGRLNPPPNKTSKHKTVNCNQTPTAEVGVEHWTCPGNGGGASNQTLSA
jgi:hypothetical protein